MYKGSSDGLLHNTWFLAIALKYQLLKIVQEEWINTENQ